MRERKKPVQIGLIGFGKFGRFLLASLSELSTVNVRSVYDPQMTAGRPAELGEDIRMTATMQEILTDPEIEAIHIATPPSEHYPLALEAISSGKHTVVEKPLALTSKQAQIIINAAREKNLVLGIHYPFRYNLILRTLRELIARNTFGKLLWLRLENAAPKPPKGHWFWDMQQSGGIHLEHGVHFFDAALWLLNKSPIDVSGNLVFREKKNTDAFARVTFPDQTLTLFAHCFLTAPYIRSTTWLLVWERARAIIYGWTPIRAEFVAQARPEEASLLRNLGFSVHKNEENKIIEAVRELATDEDRPYADAIRGFWQDVSSAVRNDESCIIPATADPVASISLAERASEVTFSLTH